MTCARNFLLIVLHIMIMAMFFLIVFYRKRNTTFGNSTPERQPVISRSRKLCTLAFVCCYNNKIIKIRQIQRDTTCDDDHHQTAYYTISIICVSVHICFFNDANNVRPYCAQPCHAVATSQPNCEWGEIRFVVCELRASFAYYKIIVVVVRSLVRSIVRSLVCSFAWYP